MKATGEPIAPGQQGEVIVPFAAPTPWQGLPAAERKPGHDTKPGTWGLIHVAEGRLRYRVTDPRRAPLDIVLTPADPPGIVEPTIRHHVEPLGPVRFQVEFWRQE